MKTYKIILFSTLLCLFVVGCASINKHTEKSLNISETSMFNDSSSASITSTRTWEPTMTASPFQSLTPSKAVSPSNTPTPYEGMYKVIQSNIIVQPNLPENISSSGQLVISDKTIWNPDVAAYFDLIDKVELVFSDERILARSISISSDGSWLLYTISRPEGLRMVFQDLITGKKNISIVVSKDSSGIKIWQNDEVEKLYEKEYLSYLEVKDKIDLDLPGFDNYQTSTFSSIPVLDPSGKYIVYSTATDLWTGLSSKYTLYDLQTKEILGHYLVHSLPDVGPPIWNHVGDKFFYLGVTDDTNLSFNFVDKSGNLNKIAEIDQEISTLTVENKIWSPDDQYLAVLIRGKQTENGAPKELFIVDTKKEQIIKTGINVFGYMDTSISMFWSPNSKQLVLENELDQDSNEVILFDLVTMQAGIALRNTSIHGWVSIPDISNYQLLSEATPLPTITPTTTPTPFPTIPAFSDLSEELLQNEDLSQIEFASSISEAISSDDYSVTREQVLSGALIREAKTREKGFFNTTVQPVDVDIFVFSDITMGFSIFSPDEYLENPDQTPCKIVSVYNLVNGDTLDVQQVILVQAWKTEEGIKYLQYIFTISDDNYEFLDRSVIILPYYYSTRVDEFKHTFENTPDQEVPLDAIWIKYYMDVRTMFKEWDNTDVFPDVLGFYPLEPIITNEYIP